MVKNRMKLLRKILGHSYMANSEKFKMATGEKKIMTKSECYIESKICLQGKMLQ